MRTGQKSVRVIETVEEVLAKIAVPNNKIKVRGADGKNYVVKGNSLRLLTFKETGTICPMCGAKATHWEITWGGNPTPHINLIGEDDLLFTHDHIVPKSQNGTDTLDNTHTMCGPCNWFLGSK